MSQVCVPQDPAAKHQILLRSSSEPSQRVGSEDQCQAEDDSADQTTSADDPGDNQTDTHANEDAGEQNAASAEATHTRRESTGRDTVIKDMIQGQEETETSDRRREDEEGNKKKDRSAELTERERERPTLRCSSSDNLLSSLTFFFTSFQSLFLHSFQFPVSGTKCFHFPNTSVSKLTESHSPFTSLCFISH